MDFLRRLFGASPVQTADPAHPPHNDDTNATRAIPERVQPEVVRAALAAGEPLTVIDIREEWEWAQAHLPAQEGRDIRHIPMHSLAARLKELPRDQPIVLLCASGNRSWSMTRSLRAQGYLAQNMEGGIARWAQRGGETARGGKPARS